MSSSSSKPPEGNKESDATGRGGGSNRNRNRKGRSGGRGRGNGGSVQAKDTEDNDDNHHAKPTPQKQQQPAIDSSQKQAASKTNRSRNQKGKQQQQQQKNKKTTEMSNEEKTRLEQEARDVEKATLLKKQQEEIAKMVAVRQKEIDGREKAVIEARDILLATLNGCQQNAANRKVLEPDNLENFRREFEINKKKLKTDLKKCTTFVKKVKSGAAWSMKATEIQQDVETLNLSRYVEEVVQAVTETSIKVSDLPTVTALCIAMHQRYADFLPNLLPAIWNVVTTSSADSAKLRRLYVRLLTEFLLNGLIPIKDVKTFTKCITEWTGANSGYAVQDANLIVAFGRAAGFEIFGVTPSTVLSAISSIETEIDKVAAVLAVKRERESLTPFDEFQEPVMLNESLLSEAGVLTDSLKSTLKTQRAIPLEVSETILKHFLGAYTTLTASLIQTHQKLQKLEKRCEQDRLLSGSLTEVREKGLNDARKLLESLLKSVQALSDCLNQPAPALVDEEDEENSQSGGGVEVWTKSGEGDVSGEDFGPFDDEETRSFYCDIPDLLTTYPPALLGLQPEDIEKKKSDNARKYGSDSLNFIEEDDQMDSIAPTSEEQLDAEDEARRAIQVQEETKVGENDNENRDTPHYRLMMLLEQELPECHRREQIDEITEKFCSTHGSSKNSRKRLLNTLFLVPRTRLDLLPYYSRMAATVDRIWTDISSTLVTDLEHQFHGQAKFKKNQNLDSRMKTARYIGELTKFRAAPPIVALRCIQRCIEDFTGSNVDVACCILESCGRFLYRTKHAKSRIVVLMDTMTRLSKAKNLDDRLQSLLKAAYFSVKPPPSGPRRKAKEYPPLESYLRHLLLIKLESTDVSVSSVTKQLLRLPWNDVSQQCGSLVCKIMLKACRKGRYKTIEAIAAVAAKLRTQRVASEATIRLIDAVIEEINWALENPNFRDQQRIITYARLHGELYCSSLIAGQVVLDQLYECINLGHEIPDSLREVSKKLIASNSDVIESDAGDEKQKVYNSAGGATFAINEDEELEETMLETTEEDFVPVKVQPVAVSAYSKYDPRVPSAIDPPNSFFRITLVCTLLDVVAKSLVSKSSLPRLKGFLAGFQRYLFTKDPLPTDVEFALLDTLDILDSQWKRLAKGSSRGSIGESHETGFQRYTCWLDAHNATVSVEESEAIFEMQKKARLEVSVDESKTVGENNDRMETNSLQDDDSMLDDEDDDGSLSLSLKDSVDGHDDDMENDAETAVDEEENDKSVQSDVDNGSDGETDEEDIDDEEFDEEAYSRQMQEEAFERELRRITMDALEKGKSVSRKQVGESMISGSQIIKKKEISKLTEVAHPPPNVIALGGKAGISFQLLKKGNKGKVEAKELLVPVDTNLALVATKQDDAAARERDEIKQRVLRYEAESADAEYAGGNVYLEQEKLQVIRNRPLLMEEIDKNFGTSGGNLRQSQRDSGRATTPSTSTDGRGRGYQGRGRSGGRGGRANIGDNIEI